MDLAFIQEQLATFATFGKNVGTAFQEVPKLFGAVLGFVDNFDTISDNTKTGFDKLSS